MTVKKEGGKVVVVTSSINNHKRPIMVKSIQSICLQQIVVMLI